MNNYSIQQLRYLNKMGSFLERCKLSKLTQAEMKMSRPVTKRLNQLFFKVSTKKSLGPDDLTNKVYKHLNKENINSSHTVPKNKIEANIS